MAKEIDEKRKRWSFIHTLVKNVILNAMSTISYSLRIFPNGVIKSIDEINSSGLKEVYRCINEGFDEWLTHVDVGVRHKEIFKDARFVLNVGFTVVNEDHVYEDLFKRIYESIGKSYARNVLNIADFTKYGSEVK